MRGPLAAMATVVVVCIMGASSAHAEVATGRSQVTWPLPSGGDYDKAYTDLAKRHGFKLPTGYTNDIRVKSGASTRARARTASGRS